MHIELYNNIKESLQGDILMEKKTYLCNICIFQVQRFFSIEGVKN